MPHPSIGLASLTVQTPDAEQPALNSSTTASKWSSKEFRLYEALVAFGVFSLVSVGVGLGSSEHLPSYWPLLRTN